MSWNEIALCSIGELCLYGETPVRYHIAAYQRGYRWKPRQVVALLSDLLAFLQSAETSSFYCLQPIVLLPKEVGRYEVVDGQQRLTTIWLILRYLDVPDSRLYQLEYATRPKLSAFLKGEGDSGENIDFFHIEAARGAIREWFREHDGESARMRDVLLHRTEVIRFELPAGEQDVTAVFARLNVGKIPLTDGELIRALFLRSDDCLTEADRQQIASEWDLLERSLQRDAFWAFLSNAPAPDDTRIGFLFGLAAEARGGARGGEGYAIFSHYAERLEQHDVMEEWRRIKAIGMELEEWFEDPALYHLIGTLVCIGVKLKQLWEQARACGKREFARTLRRQIAHKIFHKTPESLTKETVRELLEELRYGPHSERIRQVLLLFNVATLLKHQALHLRFAFHAFKKEAWDIEHVHSQADEIPEGETHRKAWLEQVRGVLPPNEDSASLLRQMDDYLLAPSDALFEALYDQVIYHHASKDHEIADHAIGNLTLLDQGTNRSYKNAIFAVKRQRIIELDRAGQFVPLATRSLFLKSYTKQPQHLLFWEPSDREAYLDEMVETLHDFFAIL